jgi:hypothetical protein
MYWLLHRMTERFSLFQKTVWLVAIPSTVPSAAPAVAAEGGLMLDGLAFGLTNNSGSY